jgi:hypothetical protein
VGERDGDSRHQMIPITTAHVAVPVEIATLARK